MNIRKLIKYLIIIIGLQLYRIISKIIIFNFVDHTVLNDEIANIIIVGFMFLVLLLICIKKHIFKYDLKYLLVFLLIVLYIFMMPFIKNDVSLYNFLAIFYNAIITVMYEELLFRGIIWNMEESSSNKKYAYIITTILFAIWHLGYIDTIIYRTGLLNNLSSIFNIVFYKVLTAFVLGVIFGGIRYKSNDVKAPIVFHMLINGILS